MSFLHDHSCMSVFEILLKMFDQKDVSRLIGYYRVCPRSEYDAQMARISKKVFGNVSGESLKRFMETPSGDHTFIEPEISYKLEKDQMEARLANKDVYWDEAMAPSNEVGLKRFKPEVENKLLALRNKLREEILVHYIDALPLSAQNNVNEALTVNILRSDLDKQFGGSIRLYELLQRYFEPDDKSTWSLAYLRSRRGQRSTDNIEKITPDAHLKYMKQLDDIEKKMNKKE